MLISAPNQKMPTAKITRLILAAMLLLAVGTASIAGLSSCTPIKPAVSVDYVVHLKDPLFQKLAHVTDVIDLEAHGTLKNGNYSTHGVPIHVEQNTKFKLAISVPVRGSSDINVGTAKGTLTFDRPISILNLPSPEKIELSNGAVSANVDFARLICVFVINCLQESASMVSSASQSSQASTKALQSMLQDFYIERANFQIKQGSSLEFEQCKCTFGPKSTLSFDHLDFNEQFDYTGNCHTDLNFGSLSARDTVANRTIATTNAQTILDLHVSRRAGIMHCSLNNVGPSSFKAQHARVADKRGTCDFENCAVELSQFELVRPDSNTNNLAFAGKLSCNNASGKLTARDSSVDLFIPSIKDASFTFNKQNASTSYQFQADNITAGKIELLAQRPQGKFSMGLKQAQIDQLTFNKSAGMNLNFNKGVCEPSFASVENAKGQRITLQFAPDSTISLKDFALNTSDLDATPDKQATMSVRKVPLTIKSGILNISSGTSKFQCRQLSGTVTVSLDAQSVQADGKLKMDVTSKQNPLGIEGARAVINDMEMHHTDKGTHLKMSACQISFTNADLKTALQKNLPKEKSFKVDKIVLDGRRWRYKNLRLTNVFLRNPSVSKLLVSQNGTVQVGAEADIKAEGTVERLELHPLQEIKRQWNEHPWSAYGHLNGTGDVAFKFIPGKSLADSSLEYKAICNLPIPDNLTVDWSQVAGDILAGAEMRLVQGVIKSANFFLPDKGIPLELTGKIEPFKQRADRSLRQVTVKTFSLKNSKDGMNVTFDAEMNL